MNYIKVSWIHDFPNEPVELYMELDDESWERRKVEVYADGRCDFAYVLGRSGTTRLSECQIPPLSEIALDPQFRPEIIPASTFEALWSTATVGGK